MTENPRRLAAGRPRLGNNSLHNMPRRSRIDLELAPAIRVCLGVEPEVSW